MELANNLWQPAPENLLLSPDEVHIWRAEIDQSQDLQAQLALTLSADEQTRANRFYFPLHQQRFIVGRGILRNILGRYLGKDPRELEFCYSDRGKPTLAASDASLCFNLSHSQGLALYAIARQRSVGIDLEYIRSMDDAAQLAQRFFTPKEAQLLQTAPEAQKQTTFFHLWTCKEAYLKATGEGIAGLRKVEIALYDGEQPQLLNLERNLGLIDQWSVHQLTIDSNYAAAYAIAGQQCQLSCWEWAL
jgi:4'-phosphopantetheinyl transferase